MVSAVSAIGAENPSPRDVFFPEEIDTLLPKLARFKIIYLTGITLAIIDEEARHRLLNCWRNVEKLERL